MATDKPDLGAAIAAAYGSDDEGTAAEAAEATSEETTTPDATGAQPDVESEGEQGSETEAQEEASSEGTDDLPDRYFEVDLSGLPAEERASIIEALKGRDDTIGKLLRGKASDEQATDDAQGAEGEQEPPPAITDEAILQALGLDPDNPFDETAAKVALPLVKAVEALTTQVQALQEERELDQLDAYWTSELDALEKQNGELPIERLALLEFAATNGYSRPADAYWAVAGPARAQVEKAVAEAQKRIATKTGTPLTKQSVATGRPKTSGADSDNVTTGKGVGKAVESAAKQLLADLGFGD